MKPPRFDYAAPADLDAVFSLRHVRTGQDELVIEREEVFTRDFDFLPFLAVHPDLDNEVGLSFT